MLDTAVILSFRLDELHELSKLSDLWVKNAVLISLYFSTQRSHIVLFIDKRFLPTAGVFSPGSATMCPGV